MAENGATSTAPFLFSFYTAHWSIRYTRAFKEEVSSFYSKHFSKPLILDKFYQTDVENALIYLLFVWNIDFINIPIEIFLQNRY